MNYGKSYFGTTVGFRNFVQENVIGSTDKNKVIPKHLLQIIIPQQKQPSNLLNQQNQFTKFLNSNALEHVQQFLRCYSMIKEFKLLKFGKYCGFNEEGYIIFSLNIISYITEKSNEWEGFCYRVGKSAYVGQFNDMKSEGMGRALYIEETRDSKKIPKKLYHIFSGTWKFGEIIKGSRSTFDFPNMNIPIIQYTGQFANFQFHGQGIRTRKDKKFEGRFERGNWVKNQGDPKASEDKIQEIKGENLQKVEILKQIEEVQAKKLNKS